MATTVVEVAVVVVTGLLTLSSLTVALPVVDKGVFVITGVKTCGLDGSGYCILGGDCTVDKEFIADSNNGHCDGLRKAFTPRAFFVCCQLANQSDTSPVKPSLKLPSNFTLISTTSTTTSTSTELPISASEESTESAESPESPESNESPESAESPESPESTEDALNDAQNKVDPEPEISTTQSSTSLLDIEVQTEISESESNIISSCDKRSSRLAVQSLNTNPSSFVCWTGALTRISPSANGYQDPGSFICAGALITETLFATTATCASRIFGQDLATFRVILGAQKIIHPAHEGQQEGNIREIREVTIHEDYTVVGGLIRGNDIAVLRLSDPSPTEVATCVVCLPEELEESNKSNNCLVSGFSHPTHGQVAESDGVLHVADQILESEHNCDLAMSNYSMATTGRANHAYGLVCASGVTNREACFSPRDAGSPLTCPTDTGYKLFGLFSSGFHCGTKSQPVLYTDTRQYVSWLQRFLP